MTLYADGWGWLTCLVLSALVLSCLAVGTRQAALVLPLLFSLLPAGSQGGPLRLGLGLECPHECLGLARASHHSHLLPLVDECLHACLGLYACI